MSARAWKSALTLGGLTLGGLFWALMLWLGWGR